MPFYQQDLRQFVTTTRGDIAANEAVPHLFTGSNYQQDVQHQRYLLQELRRKYSALERDIATLEADIVLNHGRAEAQTMIWMWPEGCRPPQIGDGLNAMRQQAAECMTSMAYLEASIAHTSEA